jgi:hypothetical protein
MKPLLDFIAFRRRAIRQRFILAIVVGNGPQQACGYSGGLQDGSDQVRRRTLPVRAREGNHFQLFCGETVQESGKRSHCPPGFGHKNLRNIKIERPFAKKGDSAPPHSFTCELMPIMVHTGQAAEK